jgi:predicted AAA+ superfamily ATPase
VRLLAEGEGVKLKHSVIRRKIGISEETQKHLLYTLEALFLIRAMKIEGDSAGNVYYFEDQAEHRFLAPDSPSIKNFEGLLYRNLRIQLFYQIDRTYTFFKFHTRGGASVPIALDIDGKKIGFIVIEEDEPTKSHAMSAHSFLRKYGNAKIVFVSTTAKNTRARDDRSLLVPLEWFC